MAFTSTDAQGLKVQNTVFVREWVKQVEFGEQFGKFAMDADIAENAGKTAEWHLVNQPTLTLDALSETDATDGETNVTLEEYSAALAYYGDYLKISELQRKTMAPGTWQEIGRAIGQMGLRKRETLLYNQFVSGTAISTGHVFCASEVLPDTGTITSGDTAQAQDFNYMAAYFRKNGYVGFPNIGNNYACIVHSDVAAQIRNEKATAEDKPVWKDAALANGGDAMILGDNRSLYGIGIFESQVITSGAPATYTSGTNAYENVALAYGALGTASIRMSRPVPYVKSAEQLAQPLDTYGTVGVKFLFAATRLDEKRALVYLSYAG